MKKILLSIVVLMVVLVGWILLKNNKSGREFLLNTPTFTVSPTQPSLVYPESTISPSLVALNSIIIYTYSGYMPKTIIIKKGEIVTWKNESDVSMWTASAGHPTHKAYPGTNIALCNVLRPTTMFDSCAGIASGQFWSFKFDNVGTWGYHNHSNPSHSGTIIVVEE